jgi:DNA-binding transcriptional ArsR family regulator
VSSPDGSDAPRRPADQVFSALADPTRRSIVELLAVGGPRTATSLAAQLSISRQAASKHLHQLGATGLARSRRVGRETQYTVDPAPLSAVADWVSQMERQWSVRLQLLAASFDEQDRAGP